VQAKRAGTMASVVVLCLVVLVSMQICSVSAETPPSQLRPTLVIDSITYTDPPTDTVWIYYTADDPLGNQLLTSDWQYSLDFGQAWNPIDPSHILYNELKTPGQPSYIVWLCQLDVPNGRYDSVLVRMKSNNGIPVGTFIKSYSTRVGACDANEPIALTFAGDELYVFDGNDQVVYGYGFDGSDNLVCKNSHTLQWNSTPITAVTGLAYDSVSTRFYAVDHVAEEIFAFDRSWTYVDQCDIGEDWPSGLSWDWLDNKVWLSGQEHDKLEQRSGSDCSEQSNCDYVNPQGVAFAGDSLWVIHDNYQWVYAMAPGSCTIGSGFEAGYINEITYHNGCLWAASDVSNSVKKFSLVPPVSEFAQSDSFPVYVHVPIPEGVPMPGVAAIESLFPNPGNPGITIALRISELINVKLDVCDAAGRIVKMLYFGPVKPGRHEFLWDGRNEEQRFVVSGCYFVRLARPGADEIKKAMMIK